MLFFVCVVSYSFWIVLFVFFFKQKTAYEMRISDWSSDVCSSDLQKSAPRNPGASVGSATSAMSRPTAIVSVCAGRWIMTARVAGAIAMTVMIATIGATACVLHAPTAMAAWKIGRTNV